MKLCMIYPTTRIPEWEPLWRALERSAGELLGDGVSLEHRFLPRSGNFARSRYAEALNNVLMAEQALAAQGEGFDGILLGCWNDPHQEVREVLDIPVASVSEQSMLTALSMGRRFAVATVSPKTAASIETDLLDYGLERRAINRPVRYLAPESNEQLLLRTVGEPNEAIRRFDKLAEELVADGAEVIVVGCTYYSALLRGAGYTATSSGALVLDSLAAGITQLCALVELARRTGYVKSNYGSFATPDRRNLDKAREALALPTTEPAQQTIGAR